MGREEAKERSGEINRCNGKRGKTRGDERGDGRQKRSKKTREQERGEGKVKRINIKRGKMRE